MDVRPEMWTKSFMSHLRDCNTICLWPERNQSPPASGFYYEQQQIKSVCIHLCIFLDPIYSWKAD